MTPNQVIAHYRAKWNVSKECAEDIFEAGERYKRLTAEPTKNEMFGNTEQLEPVAWMMKEYPHIIKQELYEIKDFDKWQPLYATPQADRDGERYRWLRANKFRHNGECWHSQHGPLLCGESLDAAIDAAMREGK